MTCHTFDEDVLMVPIVVEELVIYHVFIIESLMACCEYHLVSYLMRFLLFLVNFVRRIEKSNLKRLVSWLWHLFL